ncbi:hypothetical protein H257_08643 [Aphanomyces astaci]|uniref:Uncharacterized protein n=1 Tax=Aphanomyces astaci TaxID=112090 RepID=W4GEV3_APHAT|nr:hypothetical protein H257_08643 [Aphanomyces astaci]ETV77806.1 hypothetical protein H257_08643 [Aphanomyces astaci]|eukprot:XP_009832916.1 hypothetical protein H257_08643 [Aphanomyces astaci]
MILLATSTMFPTSCDHDTRLHRCESTSPMAIRDLLNPQPDDVMSSMVPTASMPLRVQSRKRPLEVRFHMSRLLLSRVSRPPITTLHHVQLPPKFDEMATLSPSKHPTTDDSVLLAPQQCRYRNGKCTQSRARKTNGQLHTLCDMHRHRNIVNQHRVDARRRKERLAKVV